MARGSKRDEAQNRTELPFCDKTERGCRFGALLKKQICVREGVVGLWCTSENRGNKKLSTYLVGAKIYIKVKNRFNMEEKEMRAEDEYGV